MVWDERHPVEVQSPVEIVSSPPLLPPHGACGFSSVGSLHVARDFTFTIVKELSGDAPLEKSQEAREKGAFACSSLTDSKASGFVSPQGDLSGRSAGRGRRLRAA